MAPGGDSEDTKKLDGRLQDGDSEDKDTGCCPWFKNHLGVAACLGHGLIYGVVPATSRYVQDRGYTAFQLNLFNDLLIVIAVLCVAAYHRPNLVPTSREQAFRLVCQGVGRFVGILCQFSAYRYAPPATAETVISPSTIILVAILSCIFIKEMPTRATIFGSLWCLAGIALLGYSGITNEGPSTGDTHNVGLGMGLAFSTALLFSMLYVNDKILLESTSKTMILTYTYSIATVLSGLFTIFTSQTWYLEPTSAAVLFANCASRGTAVVLMYVGLKLVEINAAMALAQADAFSSFGLQWALLGLPPTIFDGLGVTCILIGMISICVWEALVQRKKDKHGKLMKQLDFNVPPPDNDVKTLK
ncbi:uncharacterized protein LOC144870259 [Branchiostoma floridae x Branchiostoma japonicum]